MPGLRTQQGQCHKDTAPGASSPSLWPLAGCHPAADSLPTFPLWGGHSAPAPAVHSSAFLGRMRPRHPAQEAPLKLNLARSQGHGTGCAHCSLPSAPMGPQLLPTPYGGPVLGAGAGTPLAKRWRSRLCRLSSCRAGFPMGNQRGGAGGKNNTGSSGIVRGNLLSCCLQTQGLPAAPTRHGPFPGAEPLPGDGDTAGTLLAEGMVKRWVKPW